MPTVIVSVLGEEQSGGVLDPQDSPSRKGGQFESISSCPTGPTEIGSG